MGRKETNRENNIDKEIEMKQIEREILIERLGPAIDQSLFGEAITDLKLRIEYLNERFAQMLGYSGEDMMGMRVENLCREEESRKVKGALSEATKKDLYDCEIECLKKDGTPIPTEMSLSMMKNRKGKPMALIISLTDITRIKRLHQEIKELLAEWDKRIEAMEEEANELRAQIKALE